jgi:uncharacterized protein (DUF2062 family)
MPTAEVNPVVVAPTYNNARTLGDLVRGVRALGLPLIVVDDGSTDATAGLLADLAREGGVTVLTHPRNRGKAAALRSGFAAARAAGYTHVVSIDTDDQHDPAEVPKLLDRARREPAALVLGLRDDGAPNYPRKSRLGRRLSNLFIRMESGLRVEDSQCGLRVYPLGLVAAVRCRAGRFGFETEFVTRAAWAGCPVVEVPVACHYLPPGERVSHLNPLLDTLRAMAMHARLLGRALLPWPRHPQWPPPRRGTGEPVADRPVVGKGFARRFLGWIDPRDAWRQARRDRAGREAFSAGLAVGAFIGNLPAYGFHAPIGLYVARRLHLHPAAVFVGTNVSMPPLGALLNAAAIALGHVLLRGSLPTPDAVDFARHGFWKVLLNLLLEWSLGSLVVGLLCAAAVFMLSNRLLARRGSAAREPMLDARPAGASPPADAVDRSRAVADDADLHRTYPGEPPPAAPGVGPL